MADPRVSSDDLQRYKERVLSKKDEDGNYRFPELAAMLEDLPGDYDPDEQLSENE